MSNASRVPASRVSRFGRAATRCLLVLVSSVVVAALAGSSGLAAGPAREQAEPQTVKVYFVKGEQFAPRVRAVAPGRPAPTAAIEALLAGPTQAEQRTGIETTLPAETTLASLDVRGGTAIVDLNHAQARATAFDISLRPARAAQIVYTLTAFPQIDEVLINVNGVERAAFVGSKLAFRGALEQEDLNKPITLSPKANQVPSAAAPADARGVQERLVALRYLPAGSVTGTWDYRTSQAVLAFQAWHQLDRDGIVGPQTLAALESAAPPVPARSHPARHVEVFRDKGVTLLVDQGAVVRAIHSSSGAPGYETPAGEYSVFRKERSSWSVPYQVWLPYASYFNGGIAFHSHAVVPASAASHGCVRLPAPDAPAAYEFMTNGTPVVVY